MGNTHDNGRLFGTDGVQIWTEPTLELVEVDPVPADNVTVTLSADELETERAAFRAGQW